MKSKSTGPKQIRSGSKVSDGDSQAYDSKETKKAQISEISVYPIVIPRNRKGRPPKPLLETS
jgi:hypothetical protein